MARIENLTGRPVLVRLNSGRSLHLPPRQTSPEVEEVELTKNATVKKLSDQRVIRLQGAPPPGPRSHEMSAEDAISRIEDTPLDDLRGFVDTQQEKRTTVLRAWREKQQQE